MTSHHDSKNSHSSQKRPAVLQWDLDQELAEKSPLTNPLSPGPSYPRGGGSGGGSGGGISISTTTTEGLLREIRSWLKEHEISTANFFIEHYSLARLQGAIEDFERATNPDSQGRYFTPNNPTRFFRSLLVPPPQSSKTESMPAADPDKYIKGQYGHMVMRNFEQGGNQH